MKEVAIMWENPTNPAVAALEERRTCLGYDVVDSIVAVAVPVRKERTDGQRTCSDGGGRAGNPGPRDSQDTLELPAVARQDDEVGAGEVAVEGLVRGAVGDDLLRRRGVVHIPRISVLSVVWRKFRTT